MNVKVNLGGPSRPQQKKHHILRLISSMLSQQETMTAYIKPLSAPFSYFCQSISQHSVFFVTAKGYQNLQNGAVE
jgi:hypothetical protein